MGPYGRLQRNSDAAEHLVAHGMRVAVIDPLEMIKIQDSDAERLQIRSQPLKSTFQRATIADARQRIELCGSGECLGAAGGRLGQAFQALRVVVDFGKPRTALVGSDGGTIACWPVGS